VSIQESEHQIITAYAVHDKQAYKDRNVIERCHCRLKDFWRIATRYDQLARNDFSACASLPPWHSGFSRARFSAFG
jgi:transposase